MTDSQLRKAVTDWIAQDPDPITRDQAKASLKAEDWTGLRETFGTRLSFGTAGLRGPIAAGPGAMNLAVVRGVSQALVEWLAAAGQSGAVVIGYDGRHRSADFARESAAVLASAGHSVYLHDELVPTPELAHAVTALGCVAGVMVTASHNPPKDNGFKVYAADGAQILPDAADVIDKFWSPGVPAAPKNFAQLVKNGRIVPVDPTIGEAWLQALLELRVHGDVGPCPPTVYTAMHGVGSRRLMQLLEMAGHTRVSVVPEQDQPDGDFPTVAFPNPEEKGALDLAYQTADRTGSNLIIANDPDADRLAVAVRTPEGWRPLSGNEVGWLLAEDLLAHGPTDTPRMVATTIVSSGKLARIAQAHGAAYAETLTGFKWLGHVGMKFEKTGGRFVLGYEEALGYCAGGITRDKDGLNAALLLLDLAAHVHQQGRNLLDLIDDLHRAHGLHAARQTALVLPGADGRARISAAMEALRQTVPNALGGRTVAHFRDLLAGTSTELSTGTQTPITLPRSNVLAWDLADGSRVLARPSGTEPKLKLYFEIRLPVPEGADLGPLHAQAQHALADLQRDVLGRLPS